MHLASLVEMVESGFDDRVLLGSVDAPVTGTELGQRIARLLGDSVRQDHMRRAARQQFCPEAAEKIAEEIAHVL